MKRYLLTIKAEERPGLLHLLTGILNRKLVPVISLTAAPTDIHDIVLITMEIEISEKALQPLLFKIENIIEVFAVDALPLSNAVCQRVAYFRLDKALLSSSQATVISRHHAQIINLNADSVVISKSGSDTAIRNLYNDLEGPYLLGFSQSGLIADSMLIDSQEQSSVINRLAA